MNDYFRPADWAAAAKLVERVDLLHTDRIDKAAMGDERAAVRDSDLIVSLLEDRPVTVLQAAIVQLSTPELRSLPVVFGGEPL